MVAAFRPGHATAAQIAELRRLAVWPGLPPEALEHAEKRIADGLDRNEAYDLIGHYARRIQAMRSDPVQAMANEVRRRQAK